MNKVKTYIKNQNDFVNFSIFLILLNKTFKLFVVDDADKIPGIKNVKISNKVKYIDNINDILIYLDLIINVDKNKIIIYFDNNWIKYNYYNDIIDNYFYGNNFKILNLKQEILKLKLDNIERN